MRVKHRPVKRAVTIQRETTSRNGRILYYAIKDRNDPRAVAARKHMEHKAYGGIV